MAGRSDGDQYGKLRAYRFPKTRFVDGPLQIQARIDQDPQLSSQLTLWNQQGSTVIRGNLLVIPLDDTLLFAEPIYLQAETQSHARTAVGRSRDSGSSGITRHVFRRLSPSCWQAGRHPDTEAARRRNRPRLGAPPSGDIRSLVERANQALSDYRKLTSEGKLGEAG